MAEDPKPTPTPEPEYERVYKQQVKDSEHQKEVSELKAKYDLSITLLQERNGDIAHYKRMIELYEESERLQKARIASLEAQVKGLEEENAKLKAPKSKLVGGMLDKR